MKTTVCWRWRYAIGQQQLLFVEIEGEDYRLRDEKLKKISK